MTLLTIEADAWTVGVVMNEGFKESATRHWNDAMLLEGAKRFANADHLFGIAAECAIKTALSELPGFAPKGELTEKYRTHIDRLWDRIRPQGLEKRFPGLMALLKLSNPYHDWSVDQRYAREGTVSELAQQQHRDMAKRLLSAVGIKGTRAGSR